MVQTNSRNRPPQPLTAPDPNGTRLRADAHVPSAPDLFFVLREVEFVLTADTKDSLFIGIILVGYQIELLAKQVL